MVSINSIPTQKQPNVAPKQIPFSSAQYIYIFKSVSNNTHTLLCIIFFFAFDCTLTVTQLSKVLFKTHSHWYLWISIVQITIRPWVV